STFTQLLVKIFHTKFDPGWVAPTASAEPDISVHGIGGRAKASELSARQVAANELATQARNVLDRVDNLDEDRILRAFLSVVEATVRTNFFQPDAAGQHKDYVAL